MSAREQQESEPPYGLRPWQLRPGLADESPLASGAASMGAQCASHQAAACAPSQNASLPVNTATLAHAQDGTAMPALYSMQAAPYPGEGTPANELMLPYADASMPCPLPYADDSLPFPVHTAHRATQARSNVNMDSVLAAALASHVQQHFRYRQRFNPISDYPQNASHAHPFSSFVPEATALPPYDDTEAPGIQYIEEEVVGPVPPAEVANETHVMAQVKAEPCTSVHDFGTGDSQGCSHTVANMPTVPLGLNARDSAAVDSTSASHSDCPALGAPPASSGGGVATRTRQAHIQVAASASYTATSHDQVDALAMLADVALAESAEVDDLAAALQGPVHRSAPPRAGIGSVTQVRKTRCMPLSALIAPVAPQKEAGRAGARAKKRKSSQPKATRRTAAHKATRATPAAKTAQKSAGGPAAQAAAGPSEAAEEACLGASTTAAPTTSTNPAPKTTQLAALNATARVMDPATAGSEQGTALQPFAAGPSPQDGPGAEQLAQMTDVQPQQMPPSKSRKLGKQRTAQLASMQAKRKPNSPGCTSPRHSPPHSASAAQGKRRPTCIEADIPVCQEERSVVADPMLHEVRRCASSAEQSQVQNSSDAAERAGQMNAPVQATQPVEARIGAKVLTLHARSAQNLTAQFVGAPQQQKSDKAASAITRNQTEATTAADHQLAIDQQPATIERPDPPVPAQCSPAPEAVAGGAGQKRRRLAASDGSICVDATECGAARSTSDDTAHQTEVPMNPSCPVAASTPGGNPSCPVTAATPGGKRKEQTLPPSGTSADRNLATRPSAVVLGDAPAPEGTPMPSVTPAQSNAYPTSTAEGTAAAAAVTACDASMPGNAGQQAATPLAVSPQAVRSNNLDDLDTARMAVKLQAQAEKEALRAEAASAKATRTRKRRTPLSHAYPLLGGIPKRKGVYYRKKESSFEAQLDTSVFKSAHHISGGRIIYLGLYSCKPDCADSVYDALERATRTVDRTKVKLLEGCMSASHLEGHLQFPLSDYQTPDEVDTRKARTLKEFANFLKIKSDAKRPQHGKKGVAARTRRSGAVIYEARITHIPIGSFGTYTTLEAAKEAFDLGAILCKGVDWQINEPLTEYMLDGAFHEHVQIPSHVIGCIQKYLNGMQEVDAEKYSQERRRILDYFRDRDCPFT